MLLKTLFPACPICRKDNLGPFVAVVPYQNTPGALPGVGRYGLTLINAKGECCCSWADSSYYSYEEAEFVAEKVDSDDLLALWYDETVERREAPEDF